MWLPNHRPALRAGEAHGIDVSSHQGTINWRFVAADGITFAYIKASEGTRHVDRRFVRNWAEAKAAGIETGAYHFFSLCSAGAEQARNFLRTVPADADLPPAVDLELAGNCRGRPPRSRVEGELRAFLEPIERKSGQLVVLYLGRDFERRYHLRRTLERPLWVRRFLLRPSEDWGVWQLGGFAQVEGIEGPVDLDVWRRS